MRLRGTQKAPARRSASSSYLDAKIAQVVPLLAAMGCYEDSQIYGARLDAGETTTFTRELESIKVQIIEAEYPQLKARSLIPLEGGVDPGADTFTWRFFDRFGIATMIANYADDLPDVEELGTEQKTSIEGIGIAFSYSIQDVRRAAKTGRPLQARKGIAAREAAEREIDRVCAVGVANRNVPGFFKGSGVPILSVGITGAWVSAPVAATMLADLFLFAYTVFVQTKGIHSPNTMILSLAQFQAISSTPYSTLVPKTVKEVFLESQDMIRQIEPWVLTAAMAADNTHDRAVCYEKSPTNQAMIVPVEYEALPPQQKNLIFSVPGHARTGGAVWYKPLSGVYCDTLS
jgi:hypothetical protein